MTEAQVRTIIRNALGGKPQENWLDGVFDKIRDQASGQRSYQDILQDAASREQSAHPDPVHFRGFTCELHWKTYPDGRPALYLVDAITRETVAVATADLPDVPLKPGEVFIKEHSENRGMLAALGNAGRK